MPRIVSGGFQEPLENVMIFIDGYYLRKLIRDLFGDDNIDFVKMRNTLLNSYNSTPAPLNPLRANLIRAYYYDGIADKEPERTQHRKYFDSLKRSCPFLSVGLGRLLNYQMGHSDRKVLTF